MLVSRREVKSLQAISMALPDLLWGQVLVLKHFQMSDLKFQI